MLKIFPLCPKTLVLTLNRIRTWYLVLGTWYLVLGAWYLVLLVTGTHIYQQCHPHQCTTYWQCLSQNINKAEHANFLTNAMEDEKLET